MSDFADRAFPSALPPTEVELAAWQALSRNEQLGRYRERLRAPQTGRVIRATMADALIAGRRQVAVRRA